MSIVEAAWKQIAAWHDANTPPGTLRLAPGAGQAEIAAFERELGYQLTDDLRASFALHNGSEGTFLVCQGELLSLEQILYWSKEYSRWQQKDGFGIGDDWEVTDNTGPIKPIWWNKQRLLLTDNSGDHVIADFDPAEGGHYGQIIEHSHEFGPMRVLAPGFGEWLNRVADDLELGKYAYDEQEESVVELGM